MSKYYNYEIIAATALLVVFFFLPKIWRTRLFGISLGVLVVYLIIDNFDSLLELIHM